ncbi:MAG: ribosome-associated translation inhibitor RaiA [Christensenellaceae bacterium]|nr:ribosome-associated translation inhibitor RaiA [Christensenellaceae bacterium]MDD6927445.1 ribosome-associated translation inhibitor RaiA [bacterium]MDY2851331.1 ribosome-associated translation inhibitor RaiA [Christensenellaceae bacterium]MDY4676449.1 ribosome-associated translation inhibitor RaiA [Christensenellaceae bacterium]
MRIETVCKNYQMSEKLNDIIVKKVNKFDKYFDEDTRCKICLKKEGKQCKMEIQMDYKNDFLRAQAYAENFYDALDIVLPKIESQIYKHRTKLEKKLKSGAFQEKYIYADGSEPEPKLVKTKRFEMKPMGVQEAIEEFGLVGHSFYVFLDEATNTVKVLYLRDDGNVGLIDPVV